MNTYDYETREQEHKKRIDKINADMQESICEIQEIEETKSELEEFFKENPTFVIQYNNNIQEIRQESL